MYLINQIIYTVRILLTEVSNLVLAEMKHCLNCPKYEHFVNLLKKRLNLKSEATEIILCRRILNYQNHCMHTPSVIERVKKDFLSFNSLGPFTSMSLELYSFVDTSL